MAKVLIVDDDPSTVRLMALILSCERIQTIPAYDGREGLRVLAQTQPDLVLLDISMPNMDGKAFFRQARLSGYDGPVIVCSAVDARLAQRELGADAALDKPFEPEDLVSNVKELLPAGSA
jgi:DNA-binding response OmpR family regulator